MKEWRFSLCGKLHRWKDVWFGWKSLLWHCQLAELFPALDFQDIA